MSNNTPIADPNIPPPKRRKTWARPFKEEISTISPLGPENKENIPVQQNDKLEVQTEKNQILTPSRKIKTWKIVDLPSNDETFTVGKCENAAEDQTFVVETKKITHELPKLDSDISSINTTNDALLDYAQRQTPLPHLLHADNLPIGADFTPPGSGMRFGVGSTFGDNFPKSSSPKQHPRRKILKGNRSRKSQFSGSSNSSSWSGQNDDNPDNITCLLNDEINDHQQKKMSTSKSWTVAVEPTTRPDSRISIKSSTSEHTELGTFLASPRKIRQPPPKLSDAKKRREHHKRYTFFMPEVNLNNKENSNEENNKKPVNMETEDPYKIDPYDEDQRSNAILFIDKSCKEYIVAALKPDVWNKMIPGKNTLSKVRFWGSK